ncbi:MAG: sensor histidine kinase, partial [Actinomycetota bacterium]
MPSLGLLGAGLFLGGGEQIASDPWGVAFWVLLIAVVELLQVPGWKSLQVSVGFPLDMAVALLYQPAVAGVIVLLGSSDPREIRREIDSLRALFNRAQIALSVFVAALVFQSLGGSVDRWSFDVLAALPAILVSYFVNTLAVSGALSVAHNVRLSEVIRKLTVGNPLEFLVSYVGLGLLGIVLARLFLDPGAWAVAAFAGPLMLARQMLFRTRALEEATKELKDRELVLRALSDRMAEERQDERMQVAGYLHDDLAQLIFRMGIHIDTSEKLLEEGDPKKVREELESIRETKERTAELIRALIRDLHDSPIGRTGLADALSSACAEAEAESGIRIEAHLDKVEMPVPVQLLCYKVAKEAVMNAIQHAEASSISLTLARSNGATRLTVIDDGKGFDPDTELPEDHFGLTMMRER